MKSRCHFKPIAGVVLSYAENPSHNVGMGKAVFPERVQAQKMVSELAERLGSTLNEASARSILALKLEGLTPERRQELADKANEGLLTAEEFAEYETYAQLRGLLAVLQSKARFYLKLSEPA